MGIAMALADVAIVTEIYAAREQPIAGVTGEIVSKAARRAGGEVMWLPERADLVPRLEEVLRAGDVFVTLGAGDVTDVGRDFVRRRSGAAV